MEASLSRFGPIVLTAIAAVLVLLLIAVNFWGPMAVATMGDAKATLLTLVFLPALYVACSRIGEPVRAQVFQTAVPD
jgi:multidrug efflux pump subunit AcrB